MLICLDLYAPSSAPLAKILRSSAGTFVNPLTDARQDRFGTSVPVDHSPDAVDHALHELAATHYTAAR